MPGMMEIYRYHSSNYDELVNAEDYKGNLKAFLADLIPWKDKIVYEAGIGTGRVTKCFIDQVRHCYGFDRERHMLERCSLNLERYAHKLTLDVSDNTDLKPVAEKIDVFIEGWSFGHTMGENREHMAETFEKIHASILRGMSERACFILIETLGTNVGNPQIPSESLRMFYELLENRYQFRKNILRTDYSFPDCAEAARIMGFFFGDQMGDDIRESKKKVIPEFTGIWVKEI